MNVHGAGEEEWKLFIPMYMIKVVAILTCVCVFFFQGEGDREAVERSLMVLALLPSSKNNH